jgi:hypothetical protein
LDVIGGVFTENGTHAMDYFTAEVIEKTSDNVRWLISSNI